MNIIGYVITMANLQHLSRVGSPVTDSSVHIGTLYDLTKELLSIPDFPLEGYRENGFQKHGNLGIYASEDLRNFIEGDGSPDAEGVIIKLYYGDSKIKNGIDTIVYDIQGDEVIVDMQEKVEDLMEVTTREIQDDHRKKRSLLDKIIS